MYINRLEKTYGRAESTRLNPETNGFVEGKYAGTTCIRGASLRPCGIAQSRARGDCRRYTTNRTQVEREYETLVPATYNGGSVDAVSATEIPVDRSGVKETREVDLMWRRTELWPLENATQLTAFVRPGENVSVDGSIASASVGGPRSRTATMVRQIRSKRGERGYRN